MISNYIFTATAGRSGQRTLHDILVNYSNDCISEFESPTLFNNFFSGKLQILERKFRRKFLDTNELLGRGNTLRAYEKENFKYINKIVNKKLNKIKKQLKKNNSSIYFDISKFYVRSLYLGFDNLLDNYSVVLLVRDPIYNMRSFLNRKKNFFLDNSSPSQNSNLLTMDTEDWDKGEFYLWSWVETILRYNKIKSFNKVKNSLIIKSEDLEDREKVSLYLEKLGVSYQKIKIIKKLNTNLSKGFGNTEINEEDYYTLKTFVSRLSPKTIDRLGSLKESLFSFEKHI